MNTITHFFKNLRLGKVLAVGLAGLVLLVTTACSTGDAMGARPNNPPVQMGGNNNPHTMGGDGYSEYKMSTDRDAVQNKQSQLPSDRLVAVTTNATDLLYPKSDAPEASNPDIGPVGEKGKRQLIKDAKDAQAIRQPVTNPAENETLERAGKAFGEASGFLKDAGATATSDEASKQAK